MTDPLAAHIDRTSCFVEDQDGWLFYNGSSDGNALALTTGEPGTAITHVRVISLRRKISHDQARNFF